MQWTQLQLTLHRDAARQLGAVKDEVLRLLRRKKTVSEYEVQQFIVQQFKKRKLETDYRHQIVAFRQNTSHVHYMPSQYCLALRPNSLILIDIWARVHKPGSPFADMTWMAHQGSRIPGEIARVFKLVLAARDRALQHMRASLRAGQVPTGQTIDAAARSFIMEAGLEKNFLHGTGHVLGLTSPHGRARPINRRNTDAIGRHTAYTIEPGVYLPGKFGVRSEINFFIDNTSRVVVTTPVQRVLSRV